MSRWWIETRDDKVGRTTNIDCLGNLPAQKIQHRDLASTEGNKAEQSVVGDRDCFRWGSGMNGTGPLRVVYISPEIAMKMELRYQARVAG
jgi:hypothetical protein